MAEAPVKVTRGAVAFWQTATVPPIVAVGNGFTVTVADPLWAWVHAVALPSCTLRRF